ncbi:hypothetical protein [Sphingomonas bacterium]|nr:hypothetical protein [Sphingomonas bacterium]
MRSYFRHPGLEPGSNAVRGLNIKRAGLRWHHAGCRLKAGMTEVISHG